MIRVKRIEEIEDIYFDYKNQVWVVNGKYVDCGHPSEMNCECFGRLYADESVDDVVF